MSPVCQASMLYADVVFRELCPVLSLLHIVSIFLIRSDSSTSWASSFFAGLRSFVSFSLVPHSAHSHELTACNDSRSCASCVGEEIGA